MTLLPQSPFTTQEAYAAGLTHRILEGRRVRQVFVGVFVAADVALDASLLVRSALKVLPAGTIATSVTALQLHGVEVGPARPLLFCSTHPRQVRRPGLVVTRVRTLPPRRGTLVSPEHAFVSAALHLNLLELVTAGDWLLRLGRCSRAALTAYVAGASGRGAVPARRAAALVRERVDSPRETRLRLALVLAGLPDPQCNPLIGTDDRPIGRVDLVYAMFRVLIEYEGDQHRADRRQWNTDIGRHEDFLEGGYTLIRVTALRMKRTRDVVCRVHAAIRAGGYTGPEPVFTAEWCALFEA